ncbi:MAG: PAAR domain-containing protein [Polyangiaceae bacterium]|nr:PAAR domain-containing protein [Polyangiaceae bacterium]
MPMQLAARVGGRISHSVMPALRPSGAMAGAVLGGNVVGPAGLGGAGLAKVGAGVGGSSPGAPIMLLDLLPLMPHGVIMTGAPGVFLGPGAIAVPAVEPSSICALHGPMVRQPVVPAGLPTVMVNGKPLSRVGDLTTCGAFLCDGVPNVMVGGPKPPGPKVSLGDLGKSLGGVALGALLTETGAIERVTALGDTLLGAVDKAEKAAEKVIDTATGAVQAAGDAAISAVEKAAKLGEAVGSAASGLLGSLFGGGGPR